MTTRMLIETIRSCKNGTPVFNAMLEDCATRIEDFMGGPEEIEEQERKEIVAIEYDHGCTDNI